MLLPWHGRGRRFDPDQVHHFFSAGYAVRVSSVAIANPKLHHRYGSDFDCLKGLRLCCHLRKMGVCSFHQDDDGSVRIWGNFPCSGAGASFYSAEAAGFSS